MSIENNEKRTRTYLNLKVWYRLVKVIFGFFVLMSLLIFNAIIYGNGVAQIDSSKTLIYCGVQLPSNYWKILGDQADALTVPDIVTPFTSQKIGIEWSNYDFSKGFNYQEFFTNYYSNKDNITKILNVCNETDLVPPDIGDIYEIQKVAELANKYKTNYMEDNLDKQKYYEAFDAFSSDLSVYRKNTANLYGNDKLKYLDFNVKLFDIKPVYTYHEFITYFLIGNLSILLFFEVLRRVFYYIILGAIRPKK